MTEAARKREVGRGEKVLPGVWRLRLPLPWPGVPHCNAWALASGGGIVLVDTGIHEPGSLGHLERALWQVRLSLDNVRAVVCTHAHIDHYGEAKTIADRVGCPVWLHPAHQHMSEAAADPEEALRRRVEVAAASGVPSMPLAQWAEARKTQDPMLSGVVAEHRDLVPGVEIASDLGPWTVHETPGHAPSHVCLFQPEHRLLLSGDHLLGRISLYYDFGWTPDPVGEFLASLERVEVLDARLALPGHGRTFTDVQAHIEANRKLVWERLDKVEALVGADEPRTAYDLAESLFEMPLTQANAGWFLPETLCYLTHLATLGRVEKVEGDPEMWVPARAA